MRVASRRLRAGLAEHGPMFDKERCKRFRKHVRRVTRKLGKARELDVSIALALEYRESLHGPMRFALNHVLRRLRKARQSEADSIRAALAAVESRDFGRDLLPLFESVASPSRCYVAIASRGLDKRLRALVAAHREWVKSRSDADLHVLRIRLKKLRYACEIYQPLYGPDMEDVILRAKTSQEVLGKWNDWRTLFAYARNSAAKAPPKAREGMPSLCRVLEREVAASLAAVEPVVCRLLSVSARRRAALLLRSPERTCQYCQGSRN